MTTILSMLFCMPTVSIAAAPAPHNEVSYTMSVELDTKTRQIVGNESVRVKNMTGQPQSKLYFHVYPNAFRWQKDGTYVREIRRFENPDLHFLKAGEGSWLKVSSARQNSSALHFSVERELLTIELPSPLPSGANTTIEIGFVTQMAPIAERSGVWDGNYSIGQWFPKLVVYDEQGWALKHNAGYHFVGEFYGDFGSYDVSITVPKSVKVGATGHLMSESQIPEGRKTLRYRADQVHDFAWVADERFEEQTLRAGRTMIHVLTRTPRWREIGEYAKNALEYYNRRIGPYPYDDFTVAETFYNGTMEYPQIIFVRGWPQALARWIENGLTRILEIGVAHETAHQWFYGVVGNNEVVDAWLDEGFTTYFEEAYLRDAYAGKDNVVKLSSLLEITDRQLGDAIWRSQAPDITQPVQTPSYKFNDPMHYYASVYYKVALFFRHFESLVGQTKFDEIIREYFQRNKFRNARPNDWFELVRQRAGEEAENWWRTWINENPRSDFAVGKIESEKSSDGLHHHRIEVKQEGGFYAPVDVEIVESDGTKHQQRAHISKNSPSVTLEFVTNKELSTVEVDPDHVAPDVDRFNNSPGLFPKIKFWPFTTKTFREDAITLFPFPFVMKRPGIGLETGALVGAAHYLDWYGYAFMGYDWRHKSLTLDSSIDTLQPELEWGWTFQYQRDVLVDRGAIYAKKSFGPEVGHDPQNTFRVGPEYFGNLGDHIRSAGIGIEFVHSNVDNGHDIRYALTLHNSTAENINTQTAVDRPYAKARLVVPLYYQTRLDFKAITGSAFGQLGLSALYDLQADNEGGMRFDYADVGLFKVKTIRVGTVELQLPVPYSGWSDHLGIIKGHSWEWHIFSDLSPSPAHDRTLVDFGIGTRFDLATGGYGNITFNLELVPYQNVIGQPGWQAPIVLFSLSDRVY